MAEQPDRPHPPEPDDPTSLDLEPAGPEEEGVPDDEPDAMQLEAARLLANEARPGLHEQGFDDEQILAWATTFTARFGSGDVDQFLTWIEEQERQR
ncbi:MAG: hypothetical protein ACQEUI_09620 [Actinomycetota bacterium]